MPCCSMAQHARNIRGCRYLPNQSAAIDHSWMLSVISQWMNSLSPKTKKVTKFLQVTKKMMKYTVKSYKCFTYPLSLHIYQYRNKRKTLRGVPVNHHRQWDDKLKATSAASFALEDLRVSAPSSTTLYQSTWCKTKFSPYCNISEVQFNKDIRIQPN